MTRGRAVVLGVVVGLYYGAVGLAGMWLVAAVAGP